MPKHRRLLIGSRTWKVFQFSKPFTSNVSSDHPVSVAIFSEKRLEIYVAADTSVKVWNAKNGKPLRQFKNCMKSEITKMTLDYDHRKLIVGSTNGELKVFDILSGINTFDLHSHAD